MGILAKFDKQPVEVLDYDFNFEPWLTDRTDTIVTRNVTVDSGIDLETQEASTGSGIVVNSSVISGGIVKAWLSGGTHNTRYKVTCTIVTVGGRTKQAEITVTVKEV